MNYASENAQLDSTGFKQQLDEVVARASEIILGKDLELRLAVACLLARGHLLIEDLPGVGKTTLAQTLAQILGLSFQRIQFTSDMLPADILGVSVYAQHSGQFDFHPGPIFAQVVLADEVNRATARTQSALLEAMEETQVTIEGKTHPLPDPFFVIATQNPQNQIGTFPLPESQLDRFLMRVELGYPDSSAERALLTGQDRRSLLAALKPALSPTQLLSLQAAVDRVFVADALLDYLQEVLSFSRHTPDFLTGLSPRAGLAILHSARAWALMSGREQVLPEDVQTVLASVIGHRLRPAQETEEYNATRVAELIIESVPIP